jgi:hypothetical protein
MNAMTAEQSGKQMTGATVPEFAADYKVGPDTVRTWIEQGMNAAKFGYRTVRIFRPEADEWVRRKFASHNSHLA